VRLPGVPHGDRGLPNKGATSLSPRLRVQFENLAKAYLRLAEQADRNASADLTYEPPPPKLDSETKRVK